MNIIVRQNEVMNCAEVLQQRRIKISAVSLHLTRLWGGHGMGKGKTELTDCQEQ